MRCAAGRRDSSCRADSLDGRKSAHTWSDHRCTPRVRVADCARALPGSGHRLRRHAGRARDGAAAIDRGGGAPPKERAPCRARDGTRVPGPANGVRSIRSLRPGGRRERCAAVPAADARGSDARGATAAPARRAPSGARGHTRRGGSSDRRHPRAPRNRGGGSRTRAGPGMAGDLQQGRGDAVAFGREQADGPRHRAFRAGLVDAQYRCRRGRRERPRDARRERVRRGRRQCARRAQGPRRSGHTWGARRRR